MFVFVVGVSVVFLYALCRHSPDFNKMNEWTEACYIPLFGTLSTVIFVVCGLLQKETMLSLLEDRELDAEVRINAYLAAMRCVDDQMLARVQRLLESEEINQVGSFIWTHLTNLQETASPAKMSIRAILDNVQLQKQFDLDKRKFSRNIELSTFSELLNVGGSVESNLIWSADSFVPRSAMLNLTADVFGMSVNLLEVGGRVQGLEDFLEKMFGPESNVINREKRAIVHDHLLNSIDRKVHKLSYFMLLQNYITL